MSFKRDFLAEWAQLNPPSTQPGAGLGAAFQAAWRSYFAPLIMLVWLAKQAMKGV